MAVTKRRTRHRAELGALRRQTTGFPSARRVHPEPHRRYVPIGPAKACRTVRALTEQGAADPARAPAGAVGCRWCGSRHHHHLVCHHRGRIAEIEAPAIERWTLAIAARHGLREAGHHVGIFGAGRVCAAAGTGDDR